MAGCRTAAQSKVVEKSAKEDERCLQTFEGIRRAVFKKAESQITIKAYRIAEPYLIDFREGIGEANNPQLTPGQRDKNLWRMITSDKRWVPLHEQHVHCL